MRSEAQTALPLEVVSVHRNTAIQELGGLEEAAKWLGLTNPRSISNWETDERGYLTARRVCDALVAALVRKRAWDRQQAGEVLDAGELALLKLPEEDAGV